MLPPLGAIPDLPKVVAMLKKRVLPRVHFLPEELPESVDLISGLPPVAMQVGNSCVGWAIGYNHKTYDEFCEFGWDLTTPNHQFSANYIYNQINHGIDNGATPSSAYRVLVNQGCCSLINFPTTNYLTQPTTTHKEYSRPYRINTYGCSYKLHDYREILANSHMLTFLIKWGSDCDNPETTNHIIYDVNINPRGNHQICICGYDQDINGTGVSGFRFVNSHGTSYADRGFAWLSDEAINSASVMQAYWMTDNTTPPSNLRVSEMFLVWDGPSDITYEIYDKTSAVIDTTTSTMYGPVEPGTYGVGALGSECLETIVVGECPLTNCMFEVI